MHRVDAVGNLLGVRRELTEGIESLLGWRKGVRKKKTETHRKIIGGSRKAYRDLPGWREGVHQKKTKTHRKIVEGSRKVYRDSLGDSSKGSGSSLGTYGRSSEENRMTCRKNTGLVGVHLVEEDEAIKAIVMNKGREAKLGEDGSRSEGELDQHIIGATGGDTEDDEVSGGRNEDAQEEEEEPIEQCMPNVRLVDAHPLEVGMEAPESIVSSREAACE
ncbi:hypothetical protein GW17_00035181 [Ensete ventricosum]|nr:hypothetical protein GW17_00035181 [Ensete ventricosum]